MREYIDPAVQHDMYRRAGGVCEYEEPSHSHAPVKCGKDLGLGSGVLLPEGTKPDQPSIKDASPVPTATEAVTPISGK